jgi:metallophosphoesterase superfamily enzyme
MKLLDYPEAKQVIVSGDIHGDFKTLVYKLCIRYECTDSLLIVAGDCGFGFEKPGYYNQVYNAVAGRLRKANNWVVFVRGNHDNPALFSGE